MVDATLEHATPMTVSGYLHTVRSDSVIDELEDVSLVTELTAAIRRLTWLSSGTSLFKHFWMTWLPFKSLMSTTTCRLSATMMEWICEYTYLAAEPWARGRWINLATSRQIVDHLLNGTRAVHVEGDVDQVGRDGLADEVALLIRRELKELLAEVVAERVCDTTMSRMSAGRRREIVPVMRSAN
jgi:hypothetical protein